MTTANDHQSTNYEQIDLSKIVKRKIPSTNEEVTAVGLGTWQVFDVGSDVGERKKLSEVLKTFRQYDGMVIDSSPMYGSSESVVGDLVNELGMRDKTFMATKVWTQGKEEGIAQMNESLQKLQVKKIDLMQVHNLVDVQEHLKTLRDWKASGKTRYIGITHYVEDAFQQLIKLIKAEKPDFVQFNYNLLKRKAEEELLKVAMDHGTATLINRPFEEGALFTKVKNGSLPSWAKEYNIESWGQYFLKYILSHKGVTCVIPGTSKVSHMVDNMKACVEPLPDEKMRKKMVEYFEGL